MVMCTISASSALSTALIPPFSTASCAISRRMSYCPIDFMRDPLWLRNAFNLSCTSMPFILTMVSGSPSGPNPSSCNTFEPGTMTGPTCLPVLSVTVARSSLWPSKSSKSFFWWEASLMSFVVEWNMPRILVVFDACSGSFRSTVSLPLVKHCDSIRWCTSEFALVTAVPLPGIRFDFEPDISFAPRLCPAMGSDGTSELSSNVTVAMMRLWF
mmetsp:Transcript_23309/g.62571  ORF Transcript_23309/g.62571 Transcript_23309/m.62571 type:complete len:213 (-) Transcript_23309:199-837(-)